MPLQTDRRTFLKSSLAVPAVMALAPQGRGLAEPAANSTAAISEGQSALPCGQIGNLQISRLLLGGNLLTRYAHNRGVKFVSELAARYNSDEKILETLVEAERHGINTLVIHTVPAAMRLLKEHRDNRGGKIQWIICPTSPIEDGLKKYTEHVHKLVEMGVAAVYLWGNQTDRLVADGRADLIGEAVNLIKGQGVAAGVGAHDLRVIQECEERGVQADFYIKTLHHHEYANGPKAEDLTIPFREVPGYWCREPQDTIELMKKVNKPWIAFKVMAAGAIPPDEAFRYAFENGADHILAGMFDFDIAEDAGIVRDLYPKIERTRAWMS